MNSAVEKWWRNGGKSGGERGGKVCTNLTILAKCGEGLWETFGFTRVLLWFCTGFSTGRLFGFSGVEREFYTFCTYPITTITNNLIRKES